MRVVVAIDSFKGSATSLQAANWVGKGIARAAPDADVVKIPIADGGEGTVEALTTALHGRVVRRQVTGPLGGQVSAEFGLLNPTTAVIEMAQASGITLTKQAPEDALRASTYGVGELIRAAIDEGADTIYIGLGGSATTDGGAGMAKALGVQFFDANGQAIACGAQGLAKLARIDTSRLDPRLAHVAIRVLSDVTNPLIGPKGAAAIYGPQKGLTDGAIPQVDGWLAHYAALVQVATGRDVDQASGAGAAGGLGAGLLAFTNAKMYRGIEKILELLQVSTQIETADLVITGEGRMDAQSINGKAPIGIAHAAKRFGVPVVALVGARSDDLGAVYAEGIDAVWSILNRPQTLAEAMANVAVNLTTAGETAIRVFQMKRKVR
ncbi:glycerate kinase [Lacticaseibacillus paracasei]|nr:glycerate kinase [Lacticaseibacillus paracasei]MBS0992858.1 glycerate kinase [Lacticaseibacillus paracasei]